MILLLAACTDVFFETVAHGQYTLHSPVGGNKAEKPTCTLFFFFLFLKAWGVGGGGGGRWGGGGGGGAEGRSGEDFERILCRITRRQQPIAGHTAKLCIMESASRLAAPVVICMLHYPSVVARGPGL